MECGTRLWVDHPICACVRSTHSACSRVRVVLCDRLGSYSVFKQLLLENHGSASKDSLFFLKNMLAGTGFATITQHSHAADPLFPPDACVVRQVPRRACWVRWWALHSSS
jgi:hypothetical protein